MLSVSEALSENEDAIGIGRKGTIDKPYILKAPFWTVDTLFYCIPKVNNDLRFVFNIFQNVNWKAMDESTGVPSLSKTAINKVDILSPKPDEQKQIGDYFSNLDNLITLHQRKAIFPLVVYLTWEQRKLGDVLIERNVQHPQNKEFPLVSFTVEKGVTPKTDRYEREQLVQGDKKAKKYKETKLDDIVYNPANLKFGAIARNKYGNAVFSPIYITYEVNKSFALPPFIEMLVTRNCFIQNALQYQQGTVYERMSVNTEDFSNLDLVLPSKKEQSKIGEYFTNLDNLITLHRRAHFHPTKEDLQMTTTTGKDNLLFCDYYKQWITVYKEGAIRPVTMSKYLMAHKWVEKLVPELSIKDLDRFSYQKLLNDYAAEHERQTTMDFHHHLKCAILDAVDEGLIPSDPTRKAIIKGKPSRNKKPKYLNQYELHKLLDDLNLDPEVNLDWMILLIAKTGMRFSEALGLTPKDFDLSRQIVSVTKTWDYKTNCGFQPTKNQSSIRKIPLDWQTVMQFAQLIKSLPEDEPIFVKGKIYNSTVNERLARHCKRVDIPIISIHGLRHTHASLLLFAGVSIASVARRLGHSNMTTTQKTYLHIIQELESKDIDIIMRSLSNLNS